MNAQDKKGLNSISMISYKLKQRLQERWSQTTVPQGTITRAIDSVARYLKVMKHEKEDVFEIGVERYIRCECFQECDEWSNWFADLLDIVKSRLKQKEFDFKDSE